MRTPGVPPSARDLADLGLPRRGHLPDVGDETVGVDGVGDVPVRRQGEARFRRCGLDRSPANTCRGGVSAGVCAAGRDARTHRRS